MTAHLGIRYATRATGRRFDPPARAAGRLTVTRLADVPVFPQLPSRLSLAMGSAGALNPQDEDAFFLNVWAPSIGGAALPVLVFIHGGAWMTGGGSNAWYDGSALAARGLVVVTCNYRIGAVGHLADRPGDAATLLPFEDLLLVLDWVRSNIAAFGGDPGRVTVAGQSAGGWYAHLLSRSPRARGLLQRVALLSMGTRKPWTVDARDEVVQRTMARTNAQHLADAPLDELLAAGMASARTTSAPLGNAASAYLPVHSDDVPDSLFDTAECAASVHVDAALVRVTADETGAFFVGNERERTASEADADAVERRIAAAQGDGGPISLANAYRGIVGQPATPYERIRSASSWAQFQRFPLALADAYASARLPTRSTVFAHRSTMAGLGAAHCFDLPFQFNTRDAWPDAPMLADEPDAVFRRVAAATVDELVRFASDPAESVVNDHRAGARPNLIGASHEDGAER